MAQRNPALWEQSLVREAVGTIAILAVLLWLTDMAWKAIVPIAILSIGMIAHKFTDARYDLPDGTNWVFYGVSVAVTGAFLLILDGTALGGAMLVLGFWFTFDGATTAKYASSKATHEYVSEMDGEETEMMLRMQTLNSIYHHLKNTGGSQTTTKVADALDITESRTELALDYLVSKGRVEQSGTGYRATPSRWGRLSPIISFLGWLPRRVLRPISRIANAH